MRKRNVNVKQTCHWYQPLDVTCQSSCYITIQAIAEPHRWCTAAAITAEKLPAERRPIGSLIVYAPGVLSNYDMHYGMALLPRSSRALFLKGVMMLPSFLLRSGLLLLSATFCFNLERTFRLGSETEDRKVTNQIWSLEVVQLWVLSNIFWAKLFVAMHVIKPAWMIFITERGIHAVV